MDTKKKVDLGKLFSFKKPTYVESKPAKKEVVADSKAKKPLTNYLILVMGILLILLFAFFFFRYVLEKDKLDSFESNLNSAVEQVYSYNVGAVREVVIPLPSSTSSVCFNNYKEGNDFGVDVSLQPTGLDDFKVKGLFSVEKSSLCVTNSNNFKAKMQYFSKEGSNFVGIYVNSIDLSLYPAASIIAPPPAQETVENQTTETNQTKQSNLSDMQRTACETANKYSTCAKLADLPVVTNEQCCSELGMCC